MLRALLFAAAMIVVPAHAATTVSVSPFDSIELHGGGHVILRHGGAQAVHLLKGSTAFTRIHIDPSDPRKLVIDACNENCPHNYALEIAVDTPRIEGVAVSGGGKIETAGTFPGQDSIAAAVHGGGTIDVRAIDAAIAKAAVEGGGEIRVKARNALIAAVNGGGKIRYWGNPNLTQAVEGGGDVSKGG